MKKSDIAMIVLIGSISVFISFFISKFAFGDPNAESAQVQVIETFNGDLSQPDKRIFNDQAINPTIEITIGGQSKPADNETKKQNKNEDETEGEEAENNLEDQRSEDDKTIN